MRNIRKKKNTECGFTLIELMVSVAIFSIVLLFALGAILTIIDANGKARTLTSVMNNVNFAFENVTRSIKTGKEIKVNPGVNNCGTGISVGSNESIQVEAIDLTASPDTFTRVRIIYRLCTDADGHGSIEKSVDGGPYEKITSPDIDVDVLKFHLFADGQEFTGTDPELGKQPRVLVTIGGTVEFRRNVSSEFNIQTTVSVRDLNI